MGSPARRELAAGNYDFTPFVPGKLYVTWPR
jgi:hypothetical protein